MMVHQHPTPPIWNRPFWKWWFSLRVGLVLLVLLTVASIAGTLIPPEIDAQGNTIVPALERSQRLVFYSWWYKYLLLLPMAVNMTCSTIRTIAEKVLPLGRPRFMRQPSFYESVANHEAVSFGGDAETAATAFRRQGFKVFTDGPLGYAVKGTLGRWGAPVTHLGLVVILLAGFASAWFAREGGIWILEGSQTDRMMPPADSVAEGEPLGFTVRCEDFSTGFFPKTRIPSHFTSTISVRQGDGPWIPGVVEVNQSFRYGGWKFHQSSYQEVGSLERYEVAVRAPDGTTTRTLELSLSQRRAVPGVPGVEVALSAATPLEWAILRGGKTEASGRQTGAWQLEAVQFEPDFVMDGKTITSRSKEPNNPALKVAFFKGGVALGSQWLFADQRLRDMMRSMEHGKSQPFEVTLVNLAGAAPDWKCAIEVRDASGALLGNYQLAVGERVSLGGSDETATPTSAGGWQVRLGKRVPAYGTYLTLTRNPMIPVIYFGCVMMLSGTLAAFFIRFRQVWFRVDEAGHKLYAAAIYRHPMSGLDRATRAALARLAHGPALAEPEMTGQSSGKNY